MTRAEGARRPRPRPAPGEDGEAGPARQDPGGEPEIRPMRPEDLPQVAEIERAAFSVPWRETTFRRLLSHERTRAWSAVDRDGAVAGYAIMWFTENGAQLGNLAVAEAHRRRGLGRRLVRTALESVRDADAADYLILEVRESNEAAIALYRGLGFRLLGRRSEYYRSPPEDALVMGLDAR